MSYKLSYLGPEVGRPGGQSGTPEHNGKSGTNGAIL